MILRMKTGYWNILSVTILIFINAPKLLNGGVSVMSPSKELWEAWKLKFDQNFKSSGEELTYYNTWKENFEKVTMHNGRHERGESLFRLDMNNFAHLSQAQFASQMLLSPKFLPGREVDGADIFGDAPVSQNWVEKGFVTPVQNQGENGACWAYSTTGAVEGQYFNASGVLVKMSESQLEDCVGAYGSTNQAFVYLNQSGAVSQKNYPRTYYGHCETPDKPITAEVLDFRVLPFGNEGALEIAVGLIGPVSVCIDASHFSFQVYHSGIYYEPDCSQTRLDHCVLVVGYGVDKGEDFWLVKNSWGTSWGMNGYVMMAKNKDNNCGIASDVIYPLVQQAS